MTNPVDRTVRLLMADIANKEAARQLDGTAYEDPNQRLWEGLTQQLDGYGHISRVLWIALSLRLA